MAEAKNQELNRDDINIIEAALHAYDASIARQLGGKQLSTIKDILEKQREGIKALRSKLNIRG